MSTEIYTLIAMAARYLFCGLMVLVVFRAWRVTVVDNRRAKRMRDWTPETGCIGEFVINPGKTKRQKTVPVPREGVLGASDRADISIRHRDLRRFHLALEERQGGVLVKPIGKAKVLLNGGHEGAALFMRDGDTLTIGGLKLLLVLFDPVPSPRADDFLDEDRLWGSFDAPVQEKATKSAPPKSKEMRSGQTAMRPGPDDQLKAFEEDLWPDE